MFSSLSSNLLPSKILGELNESVLKEQVIEVARLLIALPSPNPPLDNTRIAVSAQEVLQKLLPSAEVTIHKFGEVSNLVARLNGSGLILVNPPWPLEGELTTLLPVLAEVLGRQSRGSFTLDWLAGETV